MQLPKTTFAFIFYFVWKHRLKFAILTASCVIWTVNDAIFPYFLKNIINAIQNYSGKPDAIYASVKWPLILLAAFWLFAEIATRVQGIIQIYTFPKFRADIRTTVFDYAKLHSPDYFHNQLAGNLAKKLSDLPTSCQTIIDIICLQFLTAIVGCTTILIMAWLTKPIFAIIFLSWITLHLTITAFFLRRSNQLWGEQADAQAHINGRIVDAFTNIINIKLFSRNHYETQYLAQFQQEEINKSKRAMWHIEWMRVALGLNGLALLFGLIATLLYGWAHHMVSLGDFTQMIMQCFWLLSWVWFVSFQLALFATETGVISNALSLIREPHDIKDRSNAKPLIVTQGAIAFERVYFSYRKNRPLFQNLNLKIYPGEKVGLVGYSGSGKTSLVNLLLRFYDIHSGRILLDGQNIAEVTQDSLRAAIAMIPQDPALFHRSLLENIRYGRLDASDQEVQAAAKLAHCHDFIMQLEQGYDTLVGERGVKLSGGQRQRIAIARAILKNAPILILDEATSSLDTVTEKQIQDSLQYLMRGKTTLVIAHRLSTLADMHRIIVFAQGQVVEDGSQKDLLNRGGHFATLWNMQSDGILPSSELIAV